MSTNTARNKSQNNTQPSLVRPNLSKQCIELVSSKVQNKVNSIKFKYIVPLCHHTSRKKQRNRRKWRIFVFINQNLNIKYSKVMSNENEIILFKSQKVVLTGFDKMLCTELTMDSIFSFTFQFTDIIHRTSHSDDSQESIFCWGTKSKL